MGQFVEVLKQAKALVACIDAGSHNPPTVAWARQVEADLFGLIEQIEKAEPVAVVDANDEGYWADILPDRDVKVGQQLFAHPAPQEAEKWQPTEQEILNAAEKAGLWPNTVHAWMPAFHRFFDALNAARKEQQ